MGNLVKKNRLLLFPAMRWKLREGYIRLSFATSMENIKTGMDRTGEIS